MIAYAAAAPYRRLEASSWTSMDSVSTDFIRGPTRINGRSNIRRASRARNSTATTSAGLTKGKVMETNLFHALAPSTLAAS